MQNKQQMGIAPLIPLAITAIPFLGDIFGSLFGKKKSKPAPPPPPPKPTVPVYVWVVGGVAITALMATLVFTSTRRRR